MNTKLRSIPIIFLSLVFTSTYVLADGLGLEYQPNFLPFSLNVNKNGIAIEGKKSIVTPIGMFSIGYETQLQSEKTQINGQKTLIIRDKQRNTDNVFMINENTPIDIKINGKANIEKSGNIFIVTLFEGEEINIGFSRKGRDNPINESDTIIFNGQIWQDEPYSYAEQDSYLPINNNEYGKVLNWFNAINYCSSIPIVDRGNNWRLPREDELVTLYENQTELKHNPRGFYWSSNPHGSDKNTAKGAWSSSRNGGQGNKNSVAYVRCVRDI